METKKDKSTQHRRHIRVDKKGTHNSAERHGAIRTRPLFLMPFTRAQRQAYWRVLTNKNSKRDKTICFERGNRWCSNFSRCRSVSSSPRHRCSMYANRNRVTVPTGACFAHEGSFPATSLHSLPPQRHLTVRVWISRQLSSEVSDGWQVLHVHVELSSHPFYVVSLQVHQRAQNSVLPPEMEP